MNRIYVGGILLLYHRPIYYKDASTIMENVSAFRKYSKFNVWEVNTELGFPKELSNIQFDIIILHYSLFGSGSRYELSEQFYEYLTEDNSSYKVAFFQDEFRYCKQRFKFINDYKVNTVYTCFEQRYHSDIYRKYTNVGNVITYLPGYVSEEMIEKGNYYRLNQNRPIDIGYRGRRLEFYMGRGAQEKHRIGIDFARLCKEKNVSLSLDICVEEIDRLYGDDWYQFIGNCKGMLGVESGVSLVDIHDEARIACQELMRNKPEITFDEVYDKILYRFDNNIPLRTISPRHFECASFGTCQILFEGNYSGIMKPFVHYIPLKKDYSNFDDVIKMFMNESVRRELTENAHRDLIASGLYSYERFISDFDQRLLEAGFDSNMKESEVAEVTALLSSGQTFRKLRKYTKRDVIFRFMLYQKIPGRKILNWALDGLMWK